jgi:hypothetical protein
VSRHSIRKRDLTMNLRDVLTAEKLGSSRITIEASEGNIYA